MRPKQRGVGHWQRNFSQCQLPARKDRREANGFHSSWRARNEFHIIETAQANGDLRYPGLFLKNSRLTPKEDLLPSAKMGEQKTKPRSDVLSRSVMSDSLQPLDSLPGSSVHGDSPGKDTGVGSLSLLQGLFPTQESNPGLPHCRQILYQLSYQYLPRKYLLEIFTKMSHKKKTEKPVRCVTRLSFLFHEPGRSDGKNTSEQSVLCRGPSLRNPRTPTLPALDQE